MCLLLLCLLKGGRSGHTLRQEGVGSDHFIMHRARGLTGEGLASALLWVPQELQDRFLRVLCYTNFCVSWCRSSRLLELWSFIGTPFGRGNSSENPPFSAF